MISLKQLGMRNHNITVMYHYVRDNSRMKCITSDEFRRLIKQIKSQYEILTLTAALTYKKRKTCVLTFDDGLKDSVFTILPILLDMKVKGIFFIPTSVLAEKKILQVQKRHLLLSEIGAKKLIRELNARLPRELEIRADPIFLADYLDDLLTCCMKWMLDFCDPEIVEPIMADIFNDYIGDEETIFDEIYLSAKDIQKLLDAGMELGVHGHSHRQLGIMTFLKQEEELAKAKKIITPIIKTSPLYLSYPSGSYNPLTLRIAIKHGYEAAITINKHDNLPDTSKYELGRYDCRDLIC